MNTVWQQRGTSLEFDVRKVSANKLMSNRFIFPSESVGEVHRDKVAIQFGRSSRCLSSAGRVQPRDLRHIRAIEMPAHGHLPRLLNHFALHPR